MKTLRDTHYRIIKEMAGRGCREVDICRGVGVSYPTWLRLKNDDPNVLDALEAGRQVEHDALRGILFDKAVGGNIVAAMFLLKCRHAYVEGQPQGGTVNVGIKLEMPGALDTKGYARIINGEVVNTKDGDHGIKTIGLPAPGPSNTRRLRPVLRRRAGRV